MPSASLRPAKEQTSMNAANKRVMDNGGPRKVRRSRLSWNGLLSERCVPFFLHPATHPTLPRAEVSATQANLSLLGCSLEDRQLSIYPEPCYAGLVQPDLVVWAHPSTVKKIE